MTVEPVLRDELLAALPSLRAFAYSFTESWDQADDLVQETITRAWARFDQFQRGTNLNAWLFTILRNLFYYEHRRRKHEIEDPEGTYAGRLKTHPDQQAHLDFEDFRRALAKRPSIYREALVLVGAEGLPYEEAAAICGVPVGTIKSRVNRARTRLAELMQVDDPEDIGPDRLVRAVLHAPDLPR